jgi:hypothetical protein
MTKGDSLKIGVPIAIAAVAIGAGAYYFSLNPGAIPAPGPGPAPVPSPIPGECSGPGDSCGPGYTCIEKCGPPVVREGDAPPGYYCATNDVASQPRNCPICLASNAMIATPWGDVSVKAIAVGDVVWSVDADGKKMAHPVLAVTKTPVGPTHMVVDLKLSDGRELFASPNHPTTDGRTVGLLKAGDAYDGASVVSAELVPYWDDATYDLLPEGDTGFYWADGVLLESTLKN